MLIKKVYQSCQDCQNNTLIILRLLKNLFFWTERRIRAVKNIASLHVFKRTEINKGEGFYGKLNIKILKFGLQVRPCPKKNLITIN